MHYTPENCNCHFSFILTFISGEALLKREEDKMRKEFSSKTNFIITDKATVKIRWKCKKDDSTNGGYSREVLLPILQKYGPLEDVVISSKRKGSALAVFNSIAGAKICMQKEKGLEACPLTFRMLHDTDQAEGGHAEAASYPTASYPTQPPPPTNNTSAAGPFSSFSSFPGTNVSYQVRKDVEAEMEAYVDVDRDYESITLMRCFIRLSYIFENMLMLCTFSNWIYGIIYIFLL